MNLPRLSDEELRDLLPLDVYQSQRKLVLEGMRAAAEAQRLKDEQWMREQKPVAEMVAMNMVGPNDGGKHLDALVDLPVGTKLFATPAPASQEGRHCAYNGGTCTRRGCAVTCHASQLADWSKCYDPAAPVTTKEAEG